MKDLDVEGLSGDQLLVVLTALSSPHRMRIMEKLSTSGRNYISQLARDVGISRPLLHLHLNKLLEAGLVTSTLELSSDGKALNYFDISPFSILLTPDAIANASQTLTIDT